MKNVTKTLAVAVLASLPVFAHIQPADAAVPGRGSVVKINGEGKRICDSFADQGAAYWSAKVRGRLEDDSGGFTDRFQVRTCFSSKVECNNFLNRIHHNVLSIEEIYYIRCRAEG